MDCTEVRFVSFLSGGFIIAIVVSSLEIKVAKRTSVDWRVLVWEGWNEDTFLHFYNSNLDPMQSS